MDLQKLNTLSLTFGKALEARLTRGDKSFELPSRREVAEICRRYTRGLFSSAIAWERGCRPLSRRRPVTAWRKLSRVCPSWPA